MGFVIIIKDILEKIEFLLNLDLQLRFMQLLCHNSCLWVNGYGD